jgi:hypothetical protein
MQGYNVPFFILVKGKAGIYPCEEAWPGVPLRKSEEAL